jgi:hypothetical protein
MEMGGLSEEAVDLIVAEAERRGAAAETAAADERRKQREQERSDRSAAEGSAAEASSAEGAAAEGGLDGAAEGAGVAPSVVDSPATQANDGES